MDGLSLDWPLLLSRPALDEVMLSGVEGMISSLHLPAGQGLRDSCRRYCGSPSLHTRRMCLQLSQSSVKGATQARRAHPDFLYGLRFQQLQLQPVCRRPLRKPLSEVTEETARPTATVTTTVTHWTRDRDFRAGGSQVEMRAR